MPHQVVQDCEARIDAKGADCEGGDGAECVVLDDTAHNHQVTVLTRRRRLPPLHDVLCVSISQRNLILDVILFIHLGYTTFAILLLTTLLGINMDMETGMPSRLPLPHNGSFGTNQFPSLSQRKPWVRRMFWFTILFLLLLT